MLYETGGYIFSVQGGGDMQEVLDHKYFLGISSQNYFHKSSLVLIQLDTNYWRYIQAVMRSFKNVATSTYSILIRIRQEINGPGDKW